MNQTKPHIILVINPGSTSTKVALFANQDKISEASLPISKEALGQFRTLWSQFDFRLNQILEFLKRQHLKAFSLTAVVGRGGLLRPLKRGTYLVNDVMIEDARKGIQGEHVSNLGCALAQKVAELYKCKAYVVDPVSVDEFETLARYSGHPLIKRRALSHSLNLRAAAIWAAEKSSLSIDKSNFVVAHLGGGISIAPVKGGRIVDVNDASSDGPFSPDRSGGLPLQPFIDLCFSGQYSKNDMKQMVMGKGGLVAYLGTNDAKEVARRIADGDKKAEEVYLAMAYQIAKEIAAMASVLHGVVDAVVITGGLAHSTLLIENIRKRIDFLGPVIIFPGELEMEAMATGAVRVLKGQEKAANY
ncbi:butyrate kinase [candidate division KSB1 bacterium]|nr:butyrate kinase [candidate division KSB1 bacterium]